MRIFSQKENPDYLYGTLTDQTATVALGVSKVQPLVFLIRQFNYMVLQDYFLSAVDEHARF